MDSSFYSHFYQPQTLWPKLRQNFCRLPDYYSFDLEKARKEFEQVCKHYPLKPFEFQGPSGKSRKRLSYQGLGLTSRVGPESHYDALSLYEKEGQIDIYQTFKNVSEKLDPTQRQIPELDETKFSFLTSACTPFFQEILGRFKSPTLKVRFLELKPGGFIPMHVDFPYYKGIRIHAALFSNPDVIWQVEDESFAIPCDGNFYWFDTGKYHAVANKGNTTRIVLSLNLSVYFDKDGKQRFGEEDCLFDLMEKREL